MNPEEIKRQNDNSVFIGQKPFMNYVTGLVMAFTANNSKEVTVKARGKLISRAVDVVEVAISRFLDNTIEVKNVKIGSENCKNKDGKSVMVSFIEISVGKK